MWLHDLHISFIYLHDRVVTIKVEHEGVEVERVLPVV